MTKNISNILIGYSHNEIDKLNTYLGNFKYIRVSPNEIGPALIRDQTIDNILYDFAIEYDYIVFDIHDIYTEPRTDNQSRRLLINNKRCVANDLNKGVILTTTLFKSNNNIELCGGISMMQMFDVVLLILNSGIKVLKNRYDHRLETCNGVYTF